MSTHDKLVLLSVVLAVVVVAVLAVALIIVRRGLTSISANLATLGSALEDVESAAPAPARARRQGDQRPVRHHPGRAARDRRQGGRGRGEEAAMTLWWIGDAVLLLVVLPVVIYLLRGVLEAARSIVPSVRRVAAAANAGSKDLDAAPLLLTTQEQVIQTVQGVANYGGSLDVILDDAEVER